jgi:hypothetical protein
MTHNSETLKKIKKRAHEIWEYRMDPMMNQYLIFDKGILRERTSQDDWLEAEREITSSMENPWLHQG